MNEIKSILLHLDASPHSTVRLALARQLASSHDASVTAMFAATPAAMSVMGSVGDAAGLFAVAAAELDEDRRRRARALFDAAQAGARVSWAELASAAVVPAFVRASWQSDLVVLGQYARGDADAGIVPADFAEAVIIGSGKPAIVVPCVGDFNRVGNTVLVAWKPVREAARAVDASLPLLRAATAVHVAAWDAEPREIERLLLRHGIEATYHSEAAAQSDIGDRILSRAADLGADLLVMGCYGHSRARELVLGGASRTVLNSMPLPVLMAH
jgi:nucleotide-binding universal stress UspA family protein